MMIATNPPTKECSKPLRKSPGGENGIIEVTASSEGIVTLKGVLTPYGRPNFYRHQNVGKKTNNVGELIDFALNEMRYIVRRLTPTECERLMGLPDGYTIPTGLRRFFGADGEPAPELVSEFVDIFDKFNAIMAEYAHKKPPKGKSYNQVAAWLKKISDPATCPDSPRYKACGNGWATNQPRWILTRLLNAEDIEW
jgi:site-specific DNA-cytosine methylase